MLFRKYESFALSWLQECCIKSSLTKALSIHITAPKIPAVFEFPARQSNGVVSASVLAFNYSRNTALVWYSLFLLLKILKGPVMTKMLIVF